MADADHDRLVEEQRAYNVTIRANAAAMQPPGALEPALLRRARLYNRDGSMKPRLVAKACDDSIQTKCGDVLIRRFPVETSRGLIIHFHGGGWALGSVYEQDNYLASLARQTSLSVVSVDYPLAPENRLPRILDVAAATLVELLKQYSGIPTCIIGDSAGAQVALLSVIRLRGQAPLLRDVCAMSLCYGIYDLSMTPSQRSWGSDFLGLSTPWLEYFYAMALPGLSRDDRSDPLLSPLYADLSGLPPALFTVGRLDPLLDDSLFLHQRWLTAGNVGRLEVWPEAAHGFNHSDTVMAGKANERIARFLVERLPPEHR